MKLVNYFLVGVASKTNEFSVALRQSIKLLLWFFGCEVCGSLFFSENKTRFGSQHVSDVWVYVRLQDMPRGLCYIYSPVFSHYSRLLNGQKI